METHEHKQSMTARELILRLLLDDHLDHRILVELSTRPDKDSKQRLFYGKVTGVFCVSSESETIIECETDKGDDE